jgi:hypothetical protein
MAFDLANYEPVEARIKRFWADYPTGRIITEIIERAEKEVIVRASVYRNPDELPASVDYAHETIGATNINRTSWLENAATSAIGRALATLGYSPKGARPSREEMTKVMVNNAFYGGKAGTITLDEVNTSGERLEAFTVALGKEFGLPRLQEFYKWARDAKALPKALEIIGQAGKSFAPAQPKSEGQETPDGNRITATKG